MLAYWQFLLTLDIEQRNWQVFRFTNDDDSDDDVELNVLGCRVDMLGTNCGQCVSHSSVLLYVHRNHKAHLDGEPRTATSTLTQLLNSDTNDTSRAH